MRARVRPGHRVTVIDLSARGALVEAERALRPNSHVDVYLETDTQRRTVSAKVVRCAVAAIDSEAGITYRAGLSFIETCQWVREALTQTGYAVHGPRAASPSFAAACVNGLPAAQDETPDAPVRGSK
jgi:PilZ domain-containing protein